MKELDDLIAEIVVDCDNEDECMTAFCMFSPRIPNEIGAVRLNT